MTFYPKILTCSVRRAEAALEVLEAETAARGEAAAATRGAAMGAINKRNAAANFDNAFRNVGARPGGQAGAKPGTAGVAEGEDVFQRRKTRVVNYWDVSKTGGAGGAHTQFFTCYEFKGPVPALPLS